MASAGIVKSLSDITVKVRAVDREKLLRRSLGDESLGEELQPLLEDIDKKMDFALQYAANVHETALSGFNEQLEIVRGQLEAQASRASTEYIANKATVLGAIRGALENIRLYWPAFVAAAIEIRGFLEDEGVRQEYANTVAKLKQESAETIERIRVESTAAIEGAKKLAEEIETKARRTATKISVRAAQQQFDDAVTPLRNAVIFWAVLGALCLVTLGLLFMKFMNTKPPEDWSWQLVFFSALRFGALATVGTVAAYCLRILRAQMHMYQQNAHRRRVANSIEAFVESALGSEQRDLILSQLVVAVSDFGNSGLLDNSSDQGGSKIMIDTISRGLSAGGKAPVG